MNTYQTLFKHIDTELRKQKGSPTVIDITGARQQDINQAVNVLTIQGFNTKVTNLNTKTTLTISI